MFDLLPSEVIENILNFYDYKNDPLSFYELRYVNKQFNKFILSKTNLYPQIPFKYNKTSLTSKKINDLCCKKTSIDTFEWLMKNKISFQLYHVRNLIMKNRLDVLHLGTRYLEFLDVLFNRFYMNDFNDLFTYSESTSPLIIAGTYGKLEIIRLLLECSNYGNPYLNGIGALFELSVKHYHKHVLSYLIDNHYEKIKDKLHIKIFSIIQGFNNIEDILFYLVMSKKIIINERFLTCLITKNIYNDLFIYCFLNNNNNNINKKNLLCHTIIYNNYDIFNFLLSEKRYNIEFNYLSQLIIENICLKTSEEFIMNLLNNHNNKIKRNIPLISICLQKNINDEFIIDLINNGFDYSYNEIEFVVKKKNIRLLKILVDSFKK